MYQPITQDVLKQKESAKRAAASKEKVINAVNLLKLQGEEITPYKVAKTAGISYNTAKNSFFIEWTHLFGDKEEL